MESPQRGRFQREAGGGRPTQARPRFGLLTHCPPTECSTDRQAGRATATSAIRRADRVAGGRLPGPPAQSDLRHCRQRLRVVRGVRVLGKTRGSSAAPRAFLIHSLSALLTLIVSPGSDLPLHLDPDQPESDDTTGRAPRPPRPPDQSPRGTGIHRNPPGRSRDRAALGRRSDDVSDRLFPSRRNRCRASGLQDG